MVEANPEAGAPETSNDADNSASNPTEAPANNQQDAATEE